MIARRFPRSRPLRPLSAQAASLQRGRRGLKGRRQDHGHDDRRYDRRESNATWATTRKRRGDDERTPAPLTQAIEPDRDQTGCRRGFRRDWRGDGFAARVG